MPNEAWGVGASLPRREDERHLHGRGEFVADIKLPGTMEVAFVRSPPRACPDQGDCCPAGSRRAGLYRRRTAAAHAGSGRHPGGWREVTGLAAAGR